MELKVHYSLRSARLLFLWLIGVEVALAAFYLVLHFTGPYIPWGPAQRIFDFDEEVTIPAWFSSLQWFVIGVILFLAAAQNQHRHRLPTYLLVAGGAVFVFLSADEGAMIHERVTTVVKTLEVDWLLFRGGHGGWILPYAVIGIVGLALFARPLLNVIRNYPRESGIAIAGAGLVVAGGVGVEILSYLFLREEGSETAYKVSVAIEELLEMVGSSTILFAVLLLAGKLTTPVLSRVEQRAAVATV